MKIEIVKDIKGIIINAKVAHEDYCGICKVEMVHAFDWYDQMEYVSVNCVIDKGVLKTGSLQLEDGIYILCCIFDENGEMILGSKSQEGFEIQKAFCIGNSIELADDSIRDIYYKVMDRRETVFSEVKGDIKNGTTLFDCYVFVKNLNVFSTMEYRDASVIPYNKYKSLSEARMIDSFFTTGDVSFDYSSSLSEGYAAVIYFKNVMADEDGEYAKKYAIERATIIANLFSISNHDNCKIIAAVTKKIKENTYSIRIIDQIYQGNLLRLADQGFTIRAVYNYLIDNDSKLKVYIKLFNEAVTEDSIWASYFKFWVLLETMAEAYGTKGKNMTAWDGTVIYKRREKGQRKIETNLESVVELLRIKFSNRYSRDFIKFPNTRINNVKDFISVCHKRRCCYAHSGGCNTNNPNLCNQKIECVRCRSCLPSKSGKFDDPVWSRLESLARELIYMEIKNSIGEVARETTYINTLIEDSLKELG